MKFAHTLAAAALAGFLAAPAYAQTPQPAPAAPAAKAMPPMAAPPAAAPMAPKAAAPAAQPKVAAPAEAAKPAKTINLNTATPAELDTIPGIGEKRSAAIIAGRPYASTSQLVSKKVLTQGIFDKVRPYVTVKLNLNTATATELDALPGIGEKRSAAIIAGRPYKAAGDLTTKKVLTPAVLKAITPYIEVR